jgi:hypothetical protein
MNLLSKVLKKFRKQDENSIAEDFLFRRDVADTSLSAISWLNPDLDDEKVESIYFNTILNFVPEKDLVRFRNTLVKEADNKVKEVSTMYSMFFSGEENDNE